MKNSILLVFVLFSWTIISCENNSNNSENTNEEENSSTSVLEIVTPPSVDALKNNPDVLWMGEMMIDYAPDFNKWEARKDEVELMKKIGVNSRNLFKTLKLQLSEYANSSNDDHKLIYKMIDNISEMDLFEDAALTKKLSTREARKLVSSIDTIITFDPKTKEEVVQVVVNEMNPNDVVSYRIKQLIYYDQKEVLFKSIPLAVAPLVVNYSDQGEVLEIQPLFWMPISTLGASPELSEPAVTWAKRSYRNFKTKKVSVIKETLSYKEAIDTMMSTIRAQSATIDLRSTFSADGLDTMQPKEIKNLGASIDTIITFDPKTFKEILQVVKSKLTGDEIKELRLIQDWVWDSKNNQLAMRFVGFNPIVYRYDASGSFLNSGPIFIRLADNADG